MLLHPAAPAGPRPAPVAASLFLHAAVFAWVLFGPRWAPAKKPQSLYQREIEPHEKKLVWYRFNNKLPEVSPPKPAKQEARKAPRPVRATIKHPKQTIIAKSTLPDPGKQMTLAPGPELKTPHELEDPNLMAFKMPEPPAPPPEPKPFTAPPAPPPIPAETPNLANGPEIAAQIPKPAPEEMPVPQPAKPAPKPFTPPPQIAREVATPQLQPGQAIVTAAAPDPTALASLPQPAKPTPKAFTPPLRTARTTGPAPTLSAGPAIAAQAPKGAEIAGAVPQPGRPQPKLFVPSKRPPSAASETNSPVLEIPPALASNVNVAVVGLNPTDRMPVMPDGSRPAQFSAAPEISPKGDDAPAGNSAGIVMKDLTISGGVEKNDKQNQRESIARLTRVDPTSRENLLAARPAAAHAAPIAALPPVSLSAVQVPAAPDPRLDGRVIYTVAIQMPNVTSYSGSWILWYAERQSDGGERTVSPPEPLRKVDPVYDLSAVDDRIEGKVQLAAIIHTDGYVYGINVVKGLDPRLDKKATEALRKWEFAPARRDGNPVDVDIVIEIPFRLRPLK